MASNNKIAEITTTTKERQIIDLTIGAKKPKTDKEKRMLQAIKSTKPGTRVEIPVNL